MAFDETNFDPVRYGVLWQRVQDMDKKMDKMEAQIDQLLELANRSKGGFWFGMSVMSAVSVFVGYVISVWKH